MKTRKIGNVEVSEIGFGCMGMSHAAGKAVSIDEGVKLLHDALDAGYTYFDTAKNYGNVDDPYHNEKILGKAFVGIRDKVFIATKTGVEFDYDIDPNKPPLIYDSSKTTIKRSVEDSLERLKTDHIDLYFQARIDPKVEAEEVAETMKELYQEGKILSWGVSEAPIEYLKRAHKVFPITAVENNYSIINRVHEDSCSFLEENNITWIAQGALSKGLLSGIHQKGEHFAKDDWRSAIINDQNIDKYADLIAYLRKLAEEKNAMASQISLAWVLEQKPYIIPIPGSTKTERIYENAKASNVSLTKEEMEHIDTLI